MNKVFTIDGIGISPILVYGNSSGDLSMAEYAVKRGGKAYMLLCDNTMRDDKNKTRRNMMAMDSFDEERIII